MQHLSEVAHILQAALNGNVQKVRDYADFLASKLTEDGETRQAHILRSILHDIPQPQVAASELPSESPWERWRRERTDDEPTSRAERTT